MHLDHNRLEESLGLFGGLLDAEKTTPIRLVVSGGSALLAGGIVARTTRDLDVLAMRGEVDGEISPAHPLPGFLNTAAARVGTELKLDTDWLNATTSLMTIALDHFPAEVWSGGEERAYGDRLRVTFLGRIGLIYLKFYAATAREEERDIEDLVALAPSGEESQWVVAWLIAEQLVDPENRSALDEVLSRIKSS